MKRVLIVTYYWPPAGGVSVQRWMKFAKYLPDFGIEPVVFIPDQAKYPFVEHELIDQVDPGLEVHKVPIWELRDVYSKIMGKLSKKKTRRKNIDELFYLPPKQRSFKQKVSLWIRSNIIFPDARMTWIGPCSKAVIDYLEQEKIDALITTGPPHSCHMIGLRVKKAFPELKWIADFRDPWTNNEWFSRMPLTRWARKRHDQAERNVLQAADHILTVSWSWSEEFEAKGARALSVITNGYDPADFKLAEPEVTEKFIISHIGTLQDDRNPHSFWSLLQSLTKQNEELRKRLEIRLVGQVGSGVRRSIAENGLESKVKYLGFVPYQQALLHMKSSHLLLLLINDDQENAKGRLPAKLYEYMAVGAPIVVFGPNSGDIQRVLGPAILLSQGPQSNAQIGDLILDLLQEERPRRMQYDHRLYERRGLTQQMSKLITDLLREI